MIECMLEGKGDKRIMMLKVDASVEKLRGAYYTPEEIAEFIITWGCADNVTSVLEPSCGDGVFLQKLMARGGDYECVAVELVKEEAEKARSLVQNDTRFDVVTNDFYNEYENHLQYRKFDLIIGNPPYIRYQYLTEEQRAEQSKILISNGLKPNKLINAWVTFVIACVQMLSSNGKFAFVIPAELLQVKYAEQLRLHLMNHLQKMTIVTFRSLVFPGVEQEVVILLGEKDEYHLDIHQIKMLEFDSINDLTINFPAMNEIVPFQDIDMTTRKWTRYFLSEEQNDCISEIKRDNRFVPFSTIGEVDIGITTGNNDFFCIDKKTVDRYDLGSVTKPLIARSVNIPGITFNHEDWMQNVELGAKTYLIDFNSVQQEELTAPQLEYITGGESIGENKGYKCSIRDRWYCIPAIWSPDAFFLRRNHLYPKFVLNNLDAVSTDTMHRIKFSMLADKRRAVLAYYNSIGLAFTELEARSYGGGVLEILPGELERVTIPNLDNVELEVAFVEELFNQIDLLVRANNDIVEVLDLVDQMILIEVLNIPRETVNCFRNIWITLRERRLGRNRNN